jgi:uncharacterized protein (TIRG00374 family)
MAKLLTPRMVLRGFEAFVLVSVVTFAGILWYGNDLGAFWASIGRIRWGWVLVGVAVASLDWFGGGLRLWVVVRHLLPSVRLRTMILAGGMGAWGAYVTPAQTGAAPMMIYTMKRNGIPVPVAFTATLITFIATVLFFALAGPIAIVAGAGRSLGQRGNVLGLSLYDLFLGSLWLFVGIGVLLVAVILFPRLFHRLLQRVSGWAMGRSPRFAHRLEAVHAGLDEAHRSVVAFNSPRGWLALLLATIISGPSHGNKLLAGYVALRAVGIQAHFVDVLLLQTMITFLLYFFAPTPGGSGVAEVLSAAVMSIYVPRELTPLYTMIWRLVLSWFTLAAGGAVFYSWVRRGLKQLDPGGGAGGEAVEAGPA